MFIFIHVMLVQQFLDSQCLVTFDIIFQPSKKYLLQLPIYKIHYFVTLITKTFPIINSTLVQILKNFETLFDQPNLPPLLKYALHPSILIFIQILPHRKLKSYLANSISKLSHSTQILELTVHDIQKSLFPFLAHHQLQHLLFIPVFNLFASIVSEPYQILPYYFFLKSLVCNSKSLLLTAIFIQLIKVFLQIF